jgi:hypothetical protein
MNLMKIIIAVFLCLQVVCATSSSAIKNEDALASALSPYGVRVAIDNECHILVLEDPQEIRLFRKVLDEFSQSFGAHRRYPHFPNPGEELNAYHSKDKDELHNWIYHNREDLDRFYGILNAFEKSVKTNPPNAAEETPPNKFSNWVRDDLERFIRERSKNGISSEKDVLIHYGEAHRFITGTAVQNSSTSLHKTVSRIRRFNSQYSTNNQWVL